MKGNDLNVSITTANGETYQQNVDMEEGGYADPGTQMYFKAGAYDQNNTTPDPATDYSEVTMKNLDVVH
ncbi:MAG: polysaccharide lyase family 7 protein [Bacteroidota bacterium]